VFCHGLALVLKQGPGHGPIEPWWLYVICSCVPATSMPRSATAFPDLDSDSFLIRFFMVFSASLDKCWDSIADTKQNGTCETLGWGLMSGYYPFM
jgi:hypothetical protein